jgi:hypothetical protein
MPDKTDITAMLREIIERHVQANQPVAATFTATFGGGRDTATQWLQYQLTSSAAEIHAIVAAVSAGEHAHHAEPAPKEHAEPAEHTKHTEPAHAVGEHVAALAESITQEALADVEGADGLSAEEINALLLEVLNEELGETATA